MAVSLTIAAVDPSLTSAAIIGGEPTRPIPQLFRGVFEAPAPAEDLAGRMARWRAHAGAIREWLLDFEPALIIIEGYSFASKGRAVLSLAEFGGVLRMALLSLHRPIVEVPPSSLKKFVTGKGNANKTEVVAALARQCQVSYATNDEYDALGLWLVGRVIADPRYARNKNETDVVRTLQNGKAKPG